MLIASIILFCFSITASSILVFHRFPSEKKKRKYSILVACRNEENNIDALLNSINEIDYPQDMFEAVIIDDASEDDTWKKLETFGKDNIKVYRLEEKSDEYKGKKAALKIASEMAEYDNFLFTDADCIIDKDALHGYNRIIGENTAIVVGRYKTMQAGAMQNVLDISSAISFALSIYLYKPFSASGMNWLVTRKAFENVGGYFKIKDIIAGDDKHLLNLIVKNGGEVRFNPYCPVVTKLDETLSTNRLKRKFGKFSSNPILIKLIMILLGIFLLGLPVSIVFKNHFPLVIYIFAMSFLWVCSIIHFREKLKIADILTFLLYPYYALYFTISGSLGKWEWKGQKQK